MDSNKDELPGPEGFIHGLTTDFVEPETLQEINNALAATSSGTAERFKKSYAGKAIYVHEFKEWYLWNGKYWKEDTTAEVRQLVKDLVPEVMANLTDAPREREKDVFYKEYKSLLDTRPIDNILKEAGSLRGIAVTAKQLDTKANYFNCQNKTLIFNNKDFTVTDHDPAHFITKISNFTYDPAAFASFYEDFEKLIFMNDAGLIDFSRKYLASAISGHLEDSICFLIGEKAANGKSTFCENMLSLFGDYASKARCNTLMNKTEQIAQARPDLVKLRGAKLVVFEEIPQGFKVNDSLLKDITGGDSVTARTLFSGNEITFKPQFKAFLYGNHEPRINGNDEGIKRRIKYIPFEYVFSEQDRSQNPKAQVLERFQGEAAGILNLLLDAYAAILRTGFTAPERVKAATSDYLAEMDIVKSFIDETYIPAPGGIILFKQVYEDFKRYCKENHEYVEASISKKALSSKLRSAGKELGLTGAKNTCLLGYAQNETNSLFEST